jgi:methylmalonyl-CoA mutase
VCETLAELGKLLTDVDLAHTRIAIDAGGNAAICALVMAHAGSALRGTLGFDPLGTLARDGALPCDLATAQALLVELSRAAAETNPQLRAAEISTDAYHLAGANAVQELAYALATGLEYLRWQLAAGSSVAAASAQLGFRVQVASDLFMELAKLRALRLGWAKVVAAYGGDADAQSTRIHAVSSARSKTRRDPWVNMLRTTTEAFAAMVGGADAVTTRGFDAALGHSDDFARRIGRNVQVILNEEAHVTQVADAAGGSYYVEVLTDQLARAAWQLLQQIEARGGMGAALASGSIAQEIAEVEKLREAAIAKRSTAITGVSEFANLGEEPVVREAVQRPSAHEASHTTVQLTAAGERVAASIAAARQGASVTQLTAALAAGTTPARLTPLPVHHTADAYEALRDRSERHATSTGQAPGVFLCNLGAIPKHKARASFASGFLNAGGIMAQDNDGFANVQEAVAAFLASKTESAVICGSDDQYAEWVPQLAAALRQSGARQIVVAGRPGDKQTEYEQAGVNLFIYMGVDVVSLLRQLLDGMGVAS